MAKKKITYSTAGFKTSEEKEKEKRKIHICVDQTKTGGRFLPTSGFGTHGYDKKAQHKADRKANKQLCKEPY